MGEGPGAGLFGERTWAADASEPQAKLASNSAHEPQNAVVDYQALTHFEVHGRNARKKVSGKSHYESKPSLLRTSLGV